MKVDSEKQGAQLAKKDDDRITPVGKIIRRTHLDVSDYQVSQHESRFGKTGSTACQKR